MKKSGFTLAEVLITLAIIGVVAALTIPTVVRNYQKQQTVTQLKKTYAALANTTNLAIAEEGPISEWDAQKYNAGGMGQGSIDFANKYIIPYLKVSKNCENNTSGDCKFNYNHLNKQYSSYLGSEYARFYLNNGTLVALVTDTGSENLYKLAYIFIDINGQKKPNTFGKDIFRFAYYISLAQESNAFSRNSIGKLVAFCDGCGRDNALNHSSWGCNRNGSGDYCARLILLDGWKISDDYPW